MDSTRAIFESSVNDLQSDAILEVSVILSGSEGSMTFQGKVVLLAGSPTGKSPEPGRCGQHRHSQGRPDPGRTLA